MKKGIIICIALLIAFSLLTMCFAETEWVKKNASLDKKEDPQVFVVTGKMKTDILKLDEITVSSVKKLISGTKSQARKVIKELEDEDKITTKKSRYNELYPSPIDIQ